MKKYTVVGKSEKKIDSLSLATGESKFVDDFELKKTLHCKLVYSPHAFAEIINIDDSEARAIDGVVDVLSENSLIVNSIVSPRGAVNLKTKNGSIYGAPRKSKKILYKILFMALILNRELLTSRVFVFGFRL